MIRRSTLVFLTCLSALAAPADASAMQTKSADSAMLSASSLNSNISSETGTASQVLVAQASGGSGGGSNLLGEPSTKSLGIGSKGEAVKALQVRLQQTNYYNGPVDGIYGLATQRAVSGFQANEGLANTGTLNDATWQKLQAFSSLTNPGSPPSSTVAVNTQNSPETAPTASDLSPIAAGSENNSDTPLDNNQGGLGKVLGLSLGLVAILSSFGVGFFVANRSKAEAEEDDWAEIDADGDRLPPQTSFLTQATGFLGSTGKRVGSSGSSGAKGGGVNVREATPADSGSSLVAPSVTALSMSGQMGEARPLAQVDVIESLIGDLRSPDPANRRKAVWELGQRGNSLAMQPLVDSMVDADSKEKSLVLAALSEIGIRSLKPMSRALAIALQDDNPEVRKNAIRDLTRVYDLVVQTSQMLGHATEDEDPEVRQTATWALDQLNRIRRTQDMDANIRSFAGSGTSAPIDLLSSEASIRRSSQ